MAHKIPSCLHTQSAVTSYGGPVEDHQPPAAIVNPPLSVVDNTRMTIVTTGVAALALLPLTHGIGSVLPHDVRAPVNVYLLGARVRPQFSIRGNAVKTAEIQCPKKDYRENFEVQWMPGGHALSSYKVFYQRHQEILSFNNAPPGDTGRDPLSHLKVDFSQQMRTLYSYAKQRGKTSLSTPTAIYADVEKSEAEVEEEAVTVVIPEMCSAVLAMIKNEYGSFEDFCYNLDLQAATAALATKREKWLREEVSAVTILRRPQ
ncbi:hypothetical protein FOZ61_002805 [Perkinsus olseni]|uniref:Uncharacterized protein n=1 Tax=Perkinsus olseni TaxID=32597 RepID=A0A7J6LSM0_PEROL|nr:hypothetical protein FOZ61_002805 [Perkinsus olseni]